MVASLYDAAALANKLLDEGKGLDKQVRRRTLARLGRDLRAVGAALGIFEQHAGGRTSRSGASALRRQARHRRRARCEALIAERDAARAAKDFARADAIRKCARRSASSCSTPRAAPTGAWSDAGSALGGLIMIETAKTPRTPRSGLQKVRTWRLRRLGGHLTGTGAKLRNMCGRATLTNEDFEGIAAELDAEYSTQDAALYRPRYNIAPSDLHWIVEHGADRRVLLPAVWGYRASGGRPLINVRGEQVGSGRGFRDAFQARRCLVVTDGFFEWDAAKTPFWFHRADKKLLLLAGLFQAPGEGAGAPPRPRFTDPDHAAEPGHRQGSRPHAGHRRAGRHRHLVDRAARRGRGPHPVGSR